MILRTRGANREIRADVWDPDTLYIPLPSQSGTWHSSSGEIMSVDKAAGLPAVLNAMRLIIETTGRLPLRVYSGFQAEKRTEENTWQWKLLHDKPNDERSAFDFWQDVAACIEGHGNAFIHKVKIQPGRVERLYLVDPMKVRIRRNRDGERVFMIHQPNGQQLELTSSEMLHIRGITLNGGDVGLSPIQAARESMGTAVARYRTEGSLWRNNAAPPGAIELPEGKVDKQKALETIAIWKMHHGGDNTGTPAILAGGAKWVPYGIPLKDAQYVEAHKFGVDDVARIFNIPAELLSGGALRQITEESSRRLLNFGLKARLDRITSALRCDPDLFPNGSVYPEFYVEEFVSADALTQTQIYHALVQAGILTPDEARAELGRPPLPDGVGAIPQITPVGGSPNPTMTPTNNGSSNGEAKQRMLADHRHRLLPEVT